MITFSEFLMLHEDIGNSLANEECYKILEKTKSEFLKLKKDKIEELKTKFPKVRMEVENFLRELPELEEALHSINFHLENERKINIFKECAFFGSEMSKLIWDFIKHSYKGLDYKSEYEAVFSFVTLFFMTAGPLMAYHVGLSGLVNFDQLPKQKSGLIMFSAIFYLINYLKSKLKEF